MTSPITHEALGHKFVATIGVQTADRVDKSRRRAAHSESKGQGDDSEIGEIQALNSLPAGGFDRDQ